MELLFIKNNFNYSLYETVNLLQSFVFIDNNVQELICFVLKYSTDVISFILSSRKELKFSSRETRMCSGSSLEINCSCRNDAEMSVTNDRDELLIQHLFVILVSNFRQVSTASYHLNLNMFQFELIEPCNCYIAQSIEHIYVDDFYNVSFYIWHNISQTASINYTALYIICPLMACF